MSKLRAFLQGRRRRGRRRRRRPHTLKTDYSGQRHQQLRSVRHSNTYQAWVYSDRRLATKALLKALGLDCSEVGTDNPAEVNLDTASCFTKDQHSLTWFINSSDPAHNYWSSWSSLKGSNPSTGPESTLEQAWKLSIDVAPHLCNTLTKKVDATIGTIGINEPPKPIRLL